MNDEQPIDIPLMSDSVLPGRLPMNPLAMTMSSPEVAGLGYGQIIIPQLFWELGYADNESRDTVSFPVSNISKLDRVILLC